MNTKLLILFIILNIINVLIQTIKSIVTIHGNKLTAAITNALAYGLYTVVVIYMTCELPLLLKAFIIGMCNLIGVYVVKYFEEKNRKDKLWKIEATFEKSKYFIENLDNWAEYTGISFNYIEIKNYYIVNFYCPTQKDSLEVKNFITNCDGKYFASESKIL